MPFYTVKQVVWVQAATPEAARRQAAPPESPAVLLVSAEEPDQWDLETSRENLATLAGMEELPRAPEEQRGT